MRSSTKKEKEIKRLTQNNRVKTNEKRQKTMISSKTKKTKAYKSWHKKSESETNKSHINKAKYKNINNDLNKYIQY